MLFREDQGGYLAGIMAASLSESGVIGVVGGREDVPPVVKFVNAYKTGAESVNPDIQVLSVYNESFTDPNKGASDAQQFLGEGADVIFGAGGQTGSGGVEAATRREVGHRRRPGRVLHDVQRRRGPGSQYLATSAIKRVDLAVFRNIVAAIDGTFEGGVYTLEAANDGITYAPFHDADIPDDVASKLEETAGRPGRRLHRHGRRSRHRTPAVAREHACEPGPAHSSRAGLVRARPRHAWVRMAR